MPNRTAAAARDGSRRSARRSRRRAGPAQRRSAYRSRARAAPAAHTGPVADQAFSDKLRDLFAGRSAERYFARRNERTAAEAFYKRAQLRAAVRGETASNRRAARPSSTYLQSVDADGLEPADYPAPNFKAGDIDALADAELRLTGEILEYARHASIGRVHFSRISNDIGFEQEAAEPAEMLVDALPAPPT